MFVALQNVDTFHIGPTWEAFNLSGKMRFSSVKQGTVLGRKANVDGDANPCIRGQVGPSSNATSRRYALGHT